MKLIVVYSFMDDELKSLANRMCMYIRAKYALQVVTQSLESLSDNLFSLRKVSLEAIQDSYKSTYFLGICKNGDSTESDLDSILKRASLKGRSTYIHGVENLSYFKRGSKGLDTLHMVLNYFIDNDKEVTVTRLNEHVSEEITEDDFDICIDAMYMDDSFSDLLGNDFVGIPYEYISIDDVEDTVPCKYSIVTKFANKRYPSLPLYFEMVSISNENGCWLTMSDSPYSLDCRDIVNDFYNLALLSFTYVPYIKGQFCDSIFNAKNTVKFKVNGKVFEQDLVINKD